MWIVSLALRRPYTFIVLAVAILLLGVFTILRTPTDIFPNIKIPVVAVVWNYAGLSPNDLATRIVLQSERTAQTTVNDVEHTESQSLSGIAVVKYFFQPNVQEEMSYAQITGVSQVQPVLGYKAEGFDVTRLPSIHSTGWHRIFPRWADWPHLTC